MPYVLILCMTPTIRSQPSYGYGYFYFLYFCKVFSIRLLRTNEEKDVSYVPLHPPLCLLHSSC